MNEIPIVQYVGAQAIKDTRREDILKVLAVRLQPEAAHALKPALDTIDNAQQLDELFEAAIRVGSVEEFRQILDENGN